MRQNFKNFIFIISVLLLLPSPASAQNANDKIKALTQEDCKKIAQRFGEPVPTTVSVDSSNSVLYSICNFQKSYPETYATKTIEDIIIFISGIDLKRYGTAENTRDDLLFDKKTASDNLAKTAKSEMRNESITETPDGYFHFLTFQSELADDDVVGSSSIVLNDFIVNVVKGSCRITVSGSSYLDNDKKARYHFYGPDNKSTNTHPNFDHNREAEILALTREKAEELLNLLDCDNGGIPSSKSNSLNKSNYTQALVIELPKENDFQKILRSDFKSASESAGITGTIFIGKVGGDGELILQLPDGKEVKLADDKSAFEGERPYSRWRDISDKRNYIAPKRNVYIEEIDCHILLEQERRNQEDIKRLGGITYASDWGVDDTIIVKPTGDCSYTNEGGPVRVLAEKGQVTFKTPGGAAVSAENADFGIGYNAKSAISIIEVYNGSITVTNKTGNSKTISQTYGSEIKQIEVNQDGIMTEKIAIPLSEWQAFLASKQEEKDETKENTLPIIGVVAVLGLGGIAFFLYRTGKLIPLYKISGQKITELLKKISKEKKTN